MDLQSLVMNLPAFALCFVFLQCSLHGREVFSGTVHYPKGQEIESRARTQRLPHEPRMEANVQAESVCMSLFLAALRACGNLEPVNAAKHQILELICIASTDVESQLK